MRRTRQWLTTIAVAVLGLALGACGRSSTPRSVSVRLRDFNIAPAVASIGRGQVEFVVRNAGPSAHQFVVLRTDYDSRGLPVKANQVNEQVSHVQLSGQINEVGRGSEESLTLALRPGRYVFICNLPGHYEQGMAAGFTVS